MVAAAQSGAAASPRAPPPNAAPAHLFGAAAPSSSVVLYGPEVLRGALHSALARAELADVQLCCERGASLEWRDDDAGQGMTPLHIVVCTDAPAAKKAAVVDWLLAQRVNVEAVDHVECTALHCAAALGDDALTARLLKAGASPRARDAEGLTALHLAANGGHLAVLKALLSHWAPVDAADFEEDAADDGADGPSSAAGKRPPGAHARDGRVAAPGASLYIARRGTALHVCAAASRLDCAAALLAAGADVRSAAGAQRSTPLHVAAREGALPLAAAFLDAGADVDARDAHGETALMRAVEGAHADLVALLLSRGADAAATSQRGLTALHIAAASGTRALFARLVAAGAAVDARDSVLYDDADGQRTPLMYAAHYGCLDAFKALLDLGAELRALSAVGWPPLFYAVENSKPVPGRADEANRHIALIRFILERDAQDKKWCTVLHGRTALMVASMQDAADAVSVLVESQPWSLNCRDARGRSAAHWAAVRGASDALEALIARGADVRCRDADGKTAGELLPAITRPPVLRQWEAERRGAAGEYRWDYGAVMEATMFRYMKKACAARRSRSGACERQCGACKRYSFDAMRCSACRAVYYCGSDCQRRDWTAGGHRLVCVAAPRRPERPAGRAMLDEMEVAPW